MPKRKKGADQMVTINTRVPHWVIDWLDEERARLVKQTGISSLNRSDVLRGVLEKAAGGESK